MHQVRADAHGVHLSVIRLATTDDAADVARLMIGFRDWQGRTEPSDASIEASVRRVACRPEHATTCSAATRRRASFSSASGTPSGPGRDDAHLEDCSSARSARGSGIGRELVEAAFERARERGCARMLLDTNESNEAALAALRVGGLQKRVEPPGGRDLFMRRRL